MKLPEFDYENDKVKAIAEAILKSNDATEVLQALSYVSCEGLAEMKNMINVILKMRHDDDKEDQTLQ